jgi:filamentous hemagglutinin
VSAATQVTLAVASVVIPFVGEEAAGAELAGDAARGLSRVPAMISSETNSAGGTVITASGGAFGSDFAPSVDAALRGGETQINVISGVHGFADGSTMPEAGFLMEDLATYADVPEVTVYDYNQLSDSQITDMVNGPNTTVGAFCNSCYVLPNPQ